MDGKAIIVVSNTHWDREFRQSFELTRSRLVEMMDRLLDILHNDPDYHSFTLDGHTILIDDYLEIRPEKRDLVGYFIGAGRLVAGPWYTLAEQFSISHEPLVRNLLWGKKTLSKYGARPGSVAYTPSSWGQTGQLPQILLDFGLNKMMFYRGISHHESDAEFIWLAPDGSEVLASRFALYARYNWYYQVHRPLTRNGKIFEKDYQWGESDEVPAKLADPDTHVNQPFELKSPDDQVDITVLENSVNDMLERESGHFTTPVFLAMNGHDISGPHPLESKIIGAAKELFAGKYDIRHGDLESFWQAAGMFIDKDKLSQLKGERRAYLKQGKWTYLFPATISARTYLKQKDFKASQTLVYEAEPMAVMSAFGGADYPKKYLERAWHYLLSNHTHDANGGCAPDVVCSDMEYRYRKVCDISSIVTVDAMSNVLKQLNNRHLEKDAIQLVVFNSLPFSRDAVVMVDLDLPHDLVADSLCIVDSNGKDVGIQFISSQQSSVFVESIWDVPSVMKTKRVQCYLHLKDLPSLGYSSFQIKSSERPQGEKPFSPRLALSKPTIITSASGMENEYIGVHVNKNGTIDILNKTNGKVYNGLNYLTDQGEAGNAWQHEDLQRDLTVDTLHTSARIEIVESGPLSATIRVFYTFEVPKDYGDGRSRNEENVAMPVQVDYQLLKGEKIVRIRLALRNDAKDHWLRANFPTGILTTHTWADSHFDVVARAIRIPDSDGWVEKALGTHPLRTFVEMHDHDNSLALITKGLFEYEAFEDKDNTLSLSLIRACRIKLAVSEEKKTELPDQGIQCPGDHIFEYAIYVNTVDWLSACLPNLAVDYIQPVRCMIGGRGKGSLPEEYSLFSLDNKKLHVTAIKMTETGNDLLIRLYNPSEQEETFNLCFSRKLGKIYLGGMDENIRNTLASNTDIIHYTAGPKKIITFIIKI